MIVNRIAISGTGVRLNDKQDVQNSLANWASWLRQRKLVGLALTGLQVLELWRFAGEQLGWAIMPFLNPQSQIALKDIIEHPESLQELKLYLAEGDD